MFVTASLHQFQLNFTNFTIEQHSLRVSEVGGSVWLADQLQLQENEILVTIAPLCPCKEVLIFFTYKSVILYNIFNKK
jgi:hypothetical protein